MHLVSHAAHDISPLHLPYNLPKSPVHLVSHAADVRRQPEREGEHLVGVRARGRVSVRARARARARVRARG